MNSNRVCSLQMFMSHITLLVERMSRLLCSLEIICLEPKEETASQSLLLTKYRWYFKLGLGTPGVTETPLDTS